MGDALKGYQLLVCRKEGSETEVSVSVVVGQQRNMPASLICAIALDEAHADLSIDDLRVLYESGRLGNEAKKHADS